MISDHPSLKNGYFASKRNNLGKNNGVAAHSSAPKKMADGKMVSRNCFTINFTWKLEMVMGSGSTFN